MKLSLRHKEGRSVTQHEAAAHRQAHASRRREKHGGQAGKPRASQGLAMAAIFTYDTTHQVLVCRPCKSCVVPTGKGPERHLRGKPHWLKGEHLRAAVEHFRSFQLRTPEQLRGWRPREELLSPCRPLADLRVFDGLVCAQEGCGFCTTVQLRMARHVATHGTTSMQHTAEVPLWQACHLQTYFTAGGLINYFLVSGDGEGEETDAAGMAGQAQQMQPVPPPSHVRALDRIRADAEEAARDKAAQAAQVEAMDCARADREPWLLRCGFPDHLRGLADGEIRSSYQLPRRNCGQKAAASPEDADLIRILEAADIYLKNAYRLCSDNSEDSMMTAQRARRLAEFYAGSTGEEGKHGRFRAYKNPSTLEKYFGKAKQLLAYWYRVLHSEGGHFTRAEGGRVPADCINPTDEQMDAWGQVIYALQDEDDRNHNNSSTNSNGNNNNNNDNDDNEDDNDDNDSVNAGGDLPLRLPRVVGNFFLSLIQHTVSSKPFQSAVLSFCAMASRVIRAGKRDGPARGAATGRWEEPAYYSSHLSALIWVAQLIIFEHACHRLRDDQEKIPELISSICSQFLEQRGETPFGHILLWRLYIFKVAKTQVSWRQARWSLDGSCITYTGTELHMGQVSQLAASEFRQAQQLLSDELLLGANISPLETWRIRDDLESKEYFDYWGENAENADVLAGSQMALLDAIESSPRLQQMFFQQADKDNKDNKYNNNGNNNDNGNNNSNGNDNGNGNDDRSLKLRSSAIRAYELQAQEFLRRILILIHILGGPPLRAPEILSAIWVNTARQRSFLIWEGRMLLHVRYHKSQEVTGAARENIRFLPEAVGNLLATFVAYVQPLRQAFLRHQFPGRLLSPHLWSTLEGRVWPDQKVSTCLRKACMRAEVPVFQIAWWRQAAASITKTKFAASDALNFDMEEVEAAEEVEDEADLAVLAEMSNHSFHTFNHAYAGSSGAPVMDTLVHRAYRASRSWQELFRADQILQGKRPRSEGDEKALAKLGAACKKMRPREKAYANEKELLAVARRLYSNPGLRFREPGQRSAMLAALGPGSLEQVVVVLATGSGKTLIVTVGVSLPTSITTILVLPTVALRVDMGSRLEKLGIRHHVWKASSRQTSPLVIVSAEAASTPQFLHYARGLQDNQKLDRVIIDECHLTITANDYRQSMETLSWALRELRTQTIWLTATLPPAYEDVFIHHNKLVQPVIIRESTNRPNIQYCVKRARSSESVNNAARAHARSWQSGNEAAIKDGARVIIYCATKDAVAEIANALGCESFTADCGTAEEKGAILQRWLGPGGSPVIVATAALGPGLDYAQVRVVIHAGVPGLISDFSQEAGRAGRDGRPAQAVMIVGSRWGLSDDYRELDADRQAMQLYALQHFCLRGVMSQFLDGPGDWRWCMAGDECCGACTSLHDTPRPAGVELRLPESMQPRSVRADWQVCSTRTYPAAAAATTATATAKAAAVAVTQTRKEEEYTGPAEIRRQARENNEVLERYEQNLELAVGCCLYCRVEGRPWTHAAMKCHRFGDWLDAKKSAQRRKKNWMPRMVVCWKCYQPQIICTKQVNGSGSTQACSFPDMVIPACFAGYNREGGPEWVHEQFGKSFKSSEEYMIWLGEEARLGGVKVIQATRVIARLLEEM